MSSVLAVTSPPGLKQCVVTLWLHSATLVFNIFLEMVIARNMRDVDVGLCTEMNAALNTSNLQQLLVVTTMNSVLRQGKK